MVLCTFLSIDIQLLINSQVCDFESVSFGDVTFILCLILNTILFKIAHEASFL
jgi:hypothetical protein